MTVLQVADLRFGYAGETLFENVTFSLKAGDRAALVAPNGAGKSTLLRLIAQELEPDQGSSVLKRGLQVGYYRQSHEVASEGDVLGAFMSGFQEIVMLRAALTQAQQDAASGTLEALARLATLSDQYQLAHGDELERKVSILAESLGFSLTDLGRPVTSLSGGERGRLNLGVVLVRQPDLLMLDEPTNHLDLDTIRWLENHLRTIRSALLIVSHDRAFLDIVSTQTIELGGRGVRVYPMRYSEYQIARAADLERERALVERQQAMVSKAEDFIRRNIAGQKTKMAQSRRKMLDKLDRLERPEDVWEVAERLRFRFAAAPRSGDIVIDAKGLAAERGGRKLFGDVELLVRRGERIGIVGPNGAGKSTLLKILAERGEPSDKGRLRRGTNLHEGYFDQHLGEVNPERTAIEEIRSVRGDFTADVARQYLARFRFWGDDPLRSVRGFSGGERSRLALAKLLLEPKNLLFLDEPTNHLDIPAAEILEEALVGFDGTVLLVSHDRRFLENVTTRLVVVRDGIVGIYPGGFRDYGYVLEAKEGDGVPLSASKRSAVALKAEPLEAVLRDRTRTRQQLEAKALDRKKKRIVELEKRINEEERVLSQKRMALRDESPEDWQRLAELAREEQDLARSLETMMEEWASLSEE